MIIGIGIALALLLILLLNRRSAGNKPGGRESDPTLHSLEGGGNPTTELPPLRVEIAPEPSTIAQPNPKPAGRETGARAKRAPAIGSTLGATPGASFVVIDVETANADYSSICQIGIAIFENGNLASEWSALVDPRDYFDPFNISIHGITEETVTGCASFGEISDLFRGFLDGRIAVCHTHFDRVALFKACIKSGIEPFQCRWIDSARVTRRAWPQFSASGYGLHNVCEFIGYEFTHHDALEDAKAAGFVMLAAIQESGLNLSGWIDRLGEPVFRTRPSPNGDKPDGEVVVFTGALSVTRANAAVLATDIGWTVNESVTKRTTLLVVGIQDYDRLAGYDKSRSHRRAEELIVQGQSIRILTEQNFMDIIGPEATKEASA